MNKLNINLQEVFFFFVLIAATIGFYSVIEPFIADIFMSVIFAIIFKRPFAYFLKVFKGKRKKATIITMTLVIFTIGIPLTFVAIMLSREVGSTYISFKNDWPVVKDYIANLPEKVSAIPILEGLVDQVDWQSLANQAGDKLSSLIEFIITVVQQTFINAGFLVIHFFVVLFLLFFLLLDGQSLVIRMKYLIPLKDTDEDEIFHKLELVTDAIVVNTFLLGLAEGVFGGTLFALLGISSPFFWGMLMTVLSIIPILGANSILFPMAIVQFIFGNIASGVIILIIGCGAILINQNIIRPRLDGAKSGIHPAMMFLASMGGLIAMGLIGFLAGPIIMGVFLVIWNIFGERYKTNLEKYNKGENLV